MTKSEEWQQFSAYRPMIEDAIRRGRNQREQEIIALLETNKPFVDPTLHDGMVYSLVLIKKQPHE